MNYNSKFLQFFVILTSVADPFHFDLDPDTNPTIIFKTLIFCLLFMSLLFNIHV